MPHLLAVEVKWNRLPRVSLQELGATNVKRNNVWLSGEKAILR